MGKPRKDSWKKLGMDLAMAATPERRAYTNRLYYILLSADADALCKRARALRKGANRA